MEITLKLIVEYNIHQVNLIILNHFKNAPAQTKTLLHSLERAAAGIGLNVYAHKMEYICFNQRGNISTLNGSSLKLVNKFIYLGRSFSSPETDINMQLAKANGHMEVRSDR